MIDEKSMWFEPTELAALDLQSGDVVVVEGGVGGYGRSAVLREDMSGYGFQNSILRIRPLAGIGWGPFIDYALQQARTAGLIEVACASATMPHFTAQKLSGFEVPAPPFEEQMAIADYLDSETLQIDTLITKQKSLIAALVERRTAVVDSVVTSGLVSGVSMRHSGVDWLGHIPSHWHTRPLWTMFDRIKDADHPDEQMLSVFRDYGVIAKESRGNINKTAENRNIYQLVHPGWLVTNRMKAWQGSVGISDLRGIVSGHYICFAPHHDESHAYLNWLFRSPRYTAAYGLISRGVRIGQAEISNDDYRVLPVVVPPLDEQLAIVDHLTYQTDKIDALIEKARRFIELARERRAALITAAVTGQIDVRERVA